MLYNRISWRIHGKFSCTWRRLITCNSCGIKLQNGNVDKIGYYTPPKTRKLNRLQGIEDVKYLLFSQNVQRAKISTGLEMTDELREAKSAPLVCKRCNDAINRNEYTLEGFKRFSFKDISSYIPNGSSVVHLVPFPEFPLHLSKDILVDDRFDASLLLTKADQVVSDKATLQKKVPVFFNEFLKSQFGSIVSNKTVATSSVKKWNIKSVYSVLKANSYLLGHANVGKSSLINALMKHYMGYKIKRNRTGDIIVPRISEQDLSKPHSFLKSQSAGVSHIPNLTRSDQEYRIGDKIIHDLPGFTENMEEIHYEDIIKKDWLDRVRKTDLFKTRKLKKRTYYSLTGSVNGACYTVGGLFFLKPPPGTINQVVKFIPGEEYEFKNIQTGLEVFRSCNEMNNHPLQKFAGIKTDICHLENYSRHIIPPFQGSIEIVMKDIGYILLRTTGKYKFTSLHEIWVPKGIQVCIREPLEILIKNGFQEYDELRSKISVCPRKRQVISSTYIMDRDQQSTLERMREMYLDRTKNDLSSRRLVNQDPMSIIQNLHEDPPNLYWYYQW